MDASDFMAATRASLSKGTLSSDQPINRDNTEKKQASFLSEFIEINAKK